MKKIYAVIVNWNRFEDTRECVESLEKSNLEGVDLKIIVVDNGSSDDSVESLSGLEVNDKRLKLLKNEKNLGFTGGNNVGIKFALEESEYILIINNDTLVDKNMIINLVKSFEDNDKVGIVSPKIYFARGYEFHKNRYQNKDLGNVIWYAGGMLDWDNVYGKNRGVDEVDKGQYDKEETIDFATGACMLVKSEVFKKVGMFDDRYFAYIEDVDFSLRAKNAEWEILYNPKAFLWHKVSQTSAIGSALNDYFITRNRMILGLSYAKVKTKLALIKESVGFITSGRPWQRKGAIDFYLSKFGIGSWK